jgi:hypothetical protein
MTGRRQVLVATGTGGAAGGMRWAPRGRHQQSLPAHGRAQRRLRVRRGGEAPPEIPDRNRIFLDEEAVYAWVEGETIVQINGAGPFDVTYVDPKDDPRNK